eukprot:697110_1
MGKRLNYQVENCLAHGIINDWDNIEKYWQRCLFQYMRCDPEEHYVLLTEPPLNPPENREYTAPLAGSDITKFILQLLRDRQEPIPPEDVKLVARTVKERFCYTCPDIVKEYSKYDNDPSRFQIYEGKHPKTGKPYKMDDQQNNYQLIWMINKQIIKPEIISFKTIPQNSVVCNRLGESVPDLNVIEQVRGSR